MKKPSDCDNTSVCTAMLPYVITAVQRANLRPIPAHFFWSLVLVSLVRADRKSSHNLSVSPNKTTADKMIMGADVPASNQKFVASCIHSSLAQRVASVAFLLVGAEVGRFAARISGLAFGLALAVRPAGSAPGSTAVRPPNATASEGGVAGVPRPDRHAPSGQLPPIRRFELTRGTSAC